MNPCVKCKYYELRDFMEYSHLCAHPVHDQRSPVYGHRILAECFSERGPKGKCGPEGVNFEPKPRPKGFWARLFRAG